MLDAARGARGLRRRRRRRAHGRADAQDARRQGRRRRASTRGTPRSASLAEQPYYTIDADTPLDEAFHFLEEHDAERVPVVERGRLVGVLSRSVLQRRLAEDEEPDAAGRRVSAIDVASARRETPGCEHVVHLNNAGAALMPDVVLRTVVEHLELEARIGGYEAAAREDDAGRGDVRLASPACSAALATRSRSSRTRPAPGTWPSTRSTSSPATGS